MRHIKTFESYSSDEVVNEEFVGKILKGILSIPKIMFGLIVIQFMDPRKIKEEIIPKLLNVYSNIDTLIDTLENIHFNKPDITDTEYKDILSKLNKLKEVKKKNPTLDDMKRRFCKYTPILNFRNRKYLADQIMQHVPKKMTAEEVLKEIKSVYKLATEEDIIGDTSPRRSWAEQFGINHGII